MGLVILIVWQKVIMRTIKISKIFILETEPMILETNLNMKSHFGKEIYYVHEINIARLCP